MTYLEFSMKRKLSERRRQQMREVKNLDSKRVCDVSADRRVIEIRRKMPCKLRQPERAEIYQRRQTEIQRINHYLEI